MLEFWELTPRETYQVMEAAIWRAEQDAQRDIALAWHTAALSRTQRMPSLKKLLQPAEAKPLKGEALKKRKEEHAAMMAGLPVSIRGKPDGG